MPKKNQISFTKPSDPSFLRALKQQIGYTDGPSLEDKRRRLEEGFDSDDDGPEVDEEQPQVVVLGSGDLTAAEAEEEKMRIERETNEKPADLSEKIIFKSKKDGDRKREGESSTEDPKDVKKKKKEQQKERQQSKSKLSFGDDDEEEEE